MVVGAELAAARHQSLLPPLRLQQDPDQTDGEVRQCQTGRQLDEHRVQPEVGAVQQAVVPPGDIADVDTVDSVAWWERRLTAPHGEREVWWYADDGGADVGEDDERQAASHCAVLVRHCRVDDGQEPPHRQHHRHEDGHRVENLRKVRMEEHVEHLRVWLRVCVVDVVLRSKRDVLEHHRQVCYSQPSQDRVRRGQHALPREHHDVDEVRDRAEEADDQRQVAVYGPVRVAQPAGALAADVARRLDAIVERDGAVLEGLPVAEGEVQAPQHRLQVQLPRLRPRLHLCVHRHDGRLAKTGLLVSSSVSVGEKISAAVDLYTSGGTSTANKKGID